MRDAAVTALLVAGTALVVLACLGVALMRDALDRLHYVGLATPGGLCLAAAILVRQGPSLIGIRAILLAALLLVTSPVLAHATARALHTARAERR